MGRDLNGLSDPFVRLQLGSTKAKSSVVSKNLNPMWYEDFYFNVGDLDEELTITVWDQDRVFDDFLGQLKIPVALVLDAEKQSLPGAWYSLQKKSEKSKISVSGNDYSLNLFSQGSFHLLGSRCLRGEDYIHGFVGNLLQGKFF